MPGKFTQLSAWKNAQVFADPAYAVPEGAAALTMTPMRTAMVMRLGEDGRPELAPMRWGFSAPNTDKFTLKHMHARSETVDSSPRFCDCFGERRGIVMVETFNEGQEQEGAPKKQFVVRPRDRKPLALAVIWEDWEGDTESITTFNMLTVPANAVISPIEERMPAILRREDWKVWLGETDATFAEIKAALRTFDDQGNWEISEQSAAKPAKAPKGPVEKPQGELF